MSFKKGDRISRQDNGVQGVVSDITSVGDYCVLVNWGDKRGSAWVRPDVIEHVSAISQLADLADPA